MFDKTRGKIDLLINDRVTQPVKTAVLISCAAFIVAGIALLVMVGGRHAGN